jgi:hypothetical protein
MAVAGGVSRCGGRNPDARGGTARNLEAKATPPKPETKKRMHVAPRKTVRADDPYL